MFPAATTVAVGRRTGTPGVETVSRPGLQAEEVTHHGLPLPAMGTRSMAILQVMYQPVGHLVGHHLDQEGKTVLLQQYPIEAQPTATEVRLAGTLAAQVQPDRRARQPGMQFTAQVPGRFDPRHQCAVQGGPVESVEPPGVEVRERGRRHGVLEWPLRAEA